jgi:hypothetical protein
MVKMVKLHMMFYYVQNVEKRRIKTIIKLNWQTMPEFYELGKMP